MERRQPVIIRGALLMSLSMSAVAVRRIFVAATQLYPVGRLNSPIRDDSFWRSDFQFLRNVSVLSRLTLRNVGSADKDTRPSTVTFNVLLRWKKQTLFLLC